MNASEIAWALVNAPLKYDERDRIVEQLIGHPRWYLDAWMSGYWRNLQGKK